MKGRRIVVAVVALALSSGALAAWSAAQRQDEVIQGATVDDQRVSDSVINSGNVRDSDLYGVRLRALTIDGTRIENAAVSNSTIRGSDVSRAVLYQVTIENSDVTGAWLERARMVGGSLTDASVRGGSFENTRLCRVLFVDEGRVDNSGCDGAPTPPPTPPPDDEDDQGDGADGGAGPAGARVTVENGGAGPLFDGNANRGKLFPDVPSGTIAQVCVFAGPADTFVDVGVSERPGSVRLFTARIDVTAANAWNCEDLARPFTGDSLFVWKIAGGARVGYDGGTPTDSWYLSGTGWREDPWRRGYRVVIESP